MSLGLTDGDNISMHIIGHIPDGLDISDIDLVLFINGRKNNIKKYTKLIDGTVSGVVHQSFATQSSRGMYEVEMKWNYREVCSKYHKFFSL